MPFDYLETRIHRGVVKSVRDLAKAAADIRNDAAFPKFAADNKAAKPARPPDMFPKTESFASGYLQPVEPANREPQIMYLSRTGESVLPVRSRSIEESWI